MVDPSSFPVLTQSQREGTSTQERDRVLPDKLTFSILIDACARTGDLEAAEKWFQRADAGAVADAGAQSLAGPRCPRSGCLGCWV